MKTKFLCGLLLAGYGISVLADPYYTGNPYSPYPPGCATVPEKQSSLYGNNIVPFWSGNLWLDVVQKIQSTDPSMNLGLVDMNLYRVACSEPGRSVIMVEFHLPPDLRDARRRQLILPGFAFEGPGGFHYAPLALNTEPHAWGQMLEQEDFTRYAIGDYTNGWDDAGRFTWRYVLDLSPVGASWGVDVTDIYNAYPRPLYIIQNGKILTWIDWPRTDELVQPNPTLPLNGRLTGIWVEEVTTDQGFVLSFSNPIPAGGMQAAAPEDSALLVFLSWFTFDTQGNALWLTGNARFPQGSSEVSIPIVQVTGGQFLGDKPAARAVVGSARLKAFSCNELELEYDLALLGLDAGGMMRLQRFQALEIAGYPCRDFKARQSSLTPD